MPQDLRQAGHMLEIEPEISHLERQPMLKNPSQVQDREGGKRSVKMGDSEEGDAGNY